MVEMIIQGAVVSGSLIVAIGSQNAFILKQGLLKNNIFYISLISFLCDFVLITIGVMGVSSWMQTIPILTQIITILGVLFLLYYGTSSFLSSYKGKSHLDNDNTDTSKKNVILLTFAMALLNPHVYIDTVVILGGIASNLTYNEKLYFLFGALIASFSWFFSLGYGARFLIPIFKKNKTWQILDFIIGCIMYLIAFNLLLMILE